MKIDGAWLGRRLDELYAIGAQPGGGTYRPLYGDAWAAACELVSGWMVEAGLDVRRDAVGNRWGRLPGSGDAGAIVTGSHIDTVRRGGRLDGALGIVAGLEAIRAVRDAFGRPRQALELLVVCEEEGSRFATNFWGSRAIAGLATAAEAEAVTDGDGVPLAHAMRAGGLDPTRLGEAARGDLEAFVELHIEQGAVLETAGAALGVVTTIAGAAQVEYRVTGRADHAGTTPMSLRQDALAGAAAMVQVVEDLARAMGPPAVATVGKLAVEPAQANVVPGAVVFVVDLRHAELDARRRLEVEIRAACDAIATRRGLGLAVRVLHERPPVSMDAGIQDVLARAAAAEGVTPRRLVSGAGHDAQVLAARCRVGMLFVPSWGGRSHCPEEATDPAHITLGARVLARTLHALAY